MHKTSKLGVKCFRIKGCDRRELLLRNASRGALRTRSVRRPSREQSRWRVAMGERALGERPSRLFVWPTYLYQHCRLMPARCPPGPGTAFSHTQRRPGGGGDDEALAASSARTATRPSLPLSIRNTEGDEPLAGHPSPTYLITAELLPEDAVLKLCAVIGDPVFF